MTAIEERAQEIVDVEVLESLDNFFEVYSTPIASKEALAVERDASMYRWRDGLPKVISGDTEISVTGTRGLTIQRSPAQTIMLHQARVLNVHKGELAEGQRIWVVQPGSERYDVTVKGMPRLVGDKNYRLYLSQVGYYQGSPKYDIVGLNGGLLELKDGKAFHSASNETEIEGRIHPPREQRH
tara:strand:- start:822 stop:1370 length:549 start_codon:yes stop_codon:yes gene_type:complete